MNAMNLGNGVIPMNHLHNSKNQHAYFNQDKGEYFENFKDALMHNLLEKGFCKYIWNTK